MNRIICKDALAALRELPDGCVNLCVTSLLLRCKDRIKLTA